MVPSFGLRKSLPILFLLLTVGSLPGSMCLAAGEADGARFTRERADSIRAGVERFFGSESPNTSEFREEVILPLAETDLTQAESEDVAVLQTALQQAVDRVENEIPNSLNHASRNPARLNDTVTKLVAVLQLADSRHSNAAILFTPESLKYAASTADWLKENGHQDLLNKIKHGFSDQQATVAGNLPAAVPDSGQELMAAERNAVVAEGASGSSRVPVELRPANAEAASDAADQSHQIVPSPASESTDTGERDFEKAILELFAAAHSDPEKFAKDYAKETPIFVTPDVAKDGANKVLQSNAAFIRDAAEGFRMHSAKGQVDIQFIGPGEQAAPAKKVTFVFRFDPTAPSQKGDGWRSPSISLQVVKPGVATEKAKQASSEKTPGFWRFRNWTRSIAQRKQGRTLRTAALMLSGLALASIVAGWLIGNLIFGSTPIGTAGFWWAINQVVLPVVFVGLPVAFFLGSLGNYWAVRRSGAGVPSPAAVVSQAPAKTASAEPTGRIQSAKRWAAETFKSVIPGYDARKDYPEGSTGPTWAKALRNGLKTGAKAGAIFIGMLFVGRMFGAAFSLSIATPLMIASLGFYSLVGLGMKAMNARKTPAPSAPQAVAADPAEQFKADFQNLVIGGQPLFSHMPENIRDENIARIVDRGIKSYERKQYYFNGKSGEPGSYDVVRYEIVHPDGTSSFIDAREKPGEAVRYYFFQSIGDGLMDVRLFDAGKDQLDRLREPEKYEQGIIAARNLIENDASIADGTRPESDEQGYAKAFQQMREADGTFEAFKDSAIPGILNGGIAKPVVRRQYRYTHPKYKDSTLITYDIVHPDGRIDIVQFIRESADRQYHRFFESTSDGRVRFRQYADGKLRKRQKDGRDIDYTLDRETAMKEAARIIREGRDNGSIEQTSGPEYEPAPAGPKPRVEPRFDIPPQN